MIPVLISDFGGVLTNPLQEAFAAYERESGIPLEELGIAMTEIAKREGDNPLFTLERGEITEAEFEQVMQEQLSAQLGSGTKFVDFADVYFQHLRPNEPFLDLLREYKSGGGRLVLLTNNVREWQPRWRAMLPIDELFEAVVDSGFVGFRKPESEIFEVTWNQVAGLHRIGKVRPSDCLLVDDIEVNCDAAIEFGFRAVQYVDKANPLRHVRAAIGF